MKKNTTQIFILGLVMIFALAIVPTISFGQSSEDNQLLKFKSEESESGNAVEGVWQVVVTFLDCQTRVPQGSIRTLRTIAQGGTLSETNPSFPGSGHGIWKRTSGQQYTVNLAFYAYEPNGDFAGNAKIKEYIRLGQNANSYTSISTFEFFDPNGNVVDSGCSTESAIRFTF
jgi:hypothetical protein